MERLHPDELRERAARHAALGDPVRLAITDELRHSDRAPVELARRLRLSSNLLAHHLDVLESVGLITRHRSSGDGRRRYVHLLQAVPDRSPPPAHPQPALFVCTHNSARSQLAAALWQHITGEAASSAGTDPADRVHPGAIAAAARSGLDLGGVKPVALSAVTDPPAMVVTVCDRAHEDLADHLPRWHWSIPDPVPDATAAAFDRVVAELIARIAPFSPPPEHEGNHDRST